MSFNTEIAAAQFEAHSDVCPLCNVPGSGLCWLGLRLLDQFSTLHCSTIFIETESKPTERNETPDDTH